MAQHFDAFRRVIRLEPDFFARTYANSGRTFMLDIGCGPATSCLALAHAYPKSHQSVFNLNYIGIDRELSMLEKARQFCERTDIFGNDFGSHNQIYFPPKRFKYTFVDRWIHWDSEWLKTWMTAGDLVLFNLSYLLGQDSFDPASAQGQQMFASLVEWVKYISMTCQAKETLLIYLNETQYNRRYMAFKNLLQLRSDGPKTTDYSYRVLSSERQRRTKDRPLAYDVAEIDWRLYVNS